MVFLKLILVILILFFGAVLCVVLVKKCSVREATCICKTFVADIFKEVFTNHAPPQYYPVFVGYDGTRIVPQFVDSAFKKISANFEVFYFTDVFYTNNESILVYRFSIQRKKSGLPDDELEKLVQKQAEETLTKTLHDFDCYVSAEPLTAVKLRANDLLVAYARTIDGISKLDEVKRRSARKCQEENSANNDFSTDWRIR